MVHWNDALALNVLRWRSEMKPWIQFFWIDVVKWDLGFASGALVQGNWFLGWTMQCWLTLTLGSIWLRWRSEMEL